MNHITYDLRDGIGLLTLNRPGVFNSLTVPLMNEARARARAITGEKVAATRREPGFS
ncbi:MAG: hypothetical protein WBN97_07535 [Parvibaculum sp.]